MMNHYNIIQNTYGRLYVVSTPIGNLSDITSRALIILQKVDLIAAENIKHTALLLKHFSIKVPLFVLNVHNEQKKSSILVRWMEEGKNIALVSNAGTPLINDPGYHLVRSCHQAGIRVIPLPGPCAAIAALSCAGLPSCRFCYEGFLPTKSKKRRDILRNLETEPRTLIFYESTHRLIESLGDMIDILGSSRYIVLVRELTKTWETIYRAPIGKLLSWIKEDENRKKGEIVLLVEGYRINKNALSIESLRVFSLLQTELTIKKSITLTSKICNVKKNILYKYALSQKSRKN